MSRHCTYRDIYFLRDGKVLAAPAKTLTNAQLVELIGCLQETVHLRSLGARETRIEEANSADANRITAEANKLERRIRKQLRLLRKLQKSET